MRYFILRTGEQYGPYSKGEVQGYLRTGDIYPGDLSRSDEMNQWLPVSQVLGTGAPPSPSPAASCNSASSIEFPPRAVLAAAEPPALHWGVLLVFAVVTAGLFSWIWSVVLAGWVRRIDPRNRAILLLICCPVLSIVAVAALFTAPDRTGLMATAVFAQLAAVAFFVVAIFGIRRSILAHYRANENPSFSLSRFMTLLFGVVYFQFKLNDMRDAERAAQFIAVHH